MTNVGNMMETLWKLTPYGNLRGITHLKTKVDNINRWKFKLEIMIRYQGIRQYLPLIYLDFITEIILKPNENENKENAWMHPERVVK